MGMKTTARKELVLLHAERFVQPGSTRDWLRVSSTFVFSSRDPCLISSSSPESTLGSRSSPRRNDWCYSRTSSRCNGSCCGRRSPQDRCSSRTPDLEVQENEPSTYPSTYSRPFRFRSSRSSTLWTFDRCRSRRRRSSRNLSYRCPSRSL